MLDLETSSDKMNENDIIAFLKSLDGLHLVTFTSRDFELAMIANKAMVYALQINSLSHTNTWYSFLDPLLAQELRLEKPVSERQYHAFRLMILDAYRKFRVLGGGVSISAHPVDEEISHLASVSLEVTPDPDERGGPIGSEGIVTFTKECGTPSGPRKSEQFAENMLKEGIQAYLMGGQSSDTPASVIKNEMLPEKDSDQILGGLFKMSTILQSDIMVVYLPENSKEQHVTAAISGNKGTLARFRGSMLGKIVRAWEKA